jgi:hypothetical protein
MSNFVEASAVGLMAGPAAPIKHKEHYPNKELNLIVMTIMSHIEITHTSIHCSLIFICNDHITLLSLQENESKLHHLENSNF